MIRAGKDNRAHHKHPRLRMTGTERTLSRHWIRTTKVRVEGRSEAYELLGVLAGECRAINIRENAKGGDHARIKIGRSRPINEGRTDSYSTVKKVRAEVGGIKIKAL